jgi:preprotein translocase subunit SecY
MLLTQQGVLIPLGITGTIMNLIIVIAGSLFTMWLGELISEFGIGNGVSLLIFGGIVSGVPAQISQLIFGYSSAQLPVYLGFVIVIVFIIAGIVMITEGERPLPVVYAKHSRGGQTYGGTASYIPLRINMAGVMPIIFGVSLLLFPQMLGNILTTTSHATLQAIGQFLTNLMSNGWIYNIAYFVLVFLFTYFYTAITFDPEQMAENLQKTGAFVPGVRPGIMTQEFISSIVSRITLVSGLFLATLAVIPTILQSVTGIAAFAVGGTSILIVVNVVTDLITKMNSQISMREY